MPFWGHNCRGTLLASPKFLLKPLPHSWDSTTVASLACCAHHVPSWPLTISLCSTCTYPISCLSPAVSRSNPTWQWQPFCSTCTSRATQQKHPGQESQVSDTAIINNVLSVTGNSACWNSAYTLTCGGAYSVPLIKDKKAEAVSQLISEAQLQPIHWALRRPNHVCKLWATSLGMLLLQTKPPSGKSGRKPLSCGWLSCSPFGSTWNLLLSHYYWLRILMPL